MKKLLFAILWFACLLTVLPFSVFAEPSADAAALQKAIDENYTDEIRYSGYLKSFGEREETLGSKDIWVPAYCVSTSELRSFTDADFDGIFDRACVALVPLIVTNESWKERGESDDNIIGHIMRLYLSSDGKLHEDIPSVYSEALRQGNYGLIKTMLEPDGLKTVCEQAGIEDPQEAVFVNITKGDSSFESALFIKTANGVCVIDLHYGGTVIEGNPNAVTLEKYKFKMKVRYPTFFEMISEWFSLKWRRSVGFRVFVIAVPLVIIAVIVTVIVLTCRKRKKKTAVQP